MFFNGSYVSRPFGEYLYNQYQPSGMAPETFGGGGFGGGGLGGMMQPPPQQQIPQAPQPQGQLGAMYQGAQLQPQSLTKMMGIWRR